MNVKIVKKWALYVGLALLTMLLQEFLFTRMQIYGIHPMLGGALTAVIAMFEGGIGGAVFGLIVGILQDTATIGYEGYYAIVYLLCGLFTGFVCEYMFRKSILTALLWALISSAAATLFYYMLFFLITGRAGIAALWQVALPEIIYSTMMTPLVYYPAMRIALGLPIKDI